MKTVKAPQYEDIGDFKVLEGVLAIQTHLFLQGKPSHKAFLESKTKLEKAVDELNACFIVEQHFEALCVQFPHYVVLCVRDTRKNVSYFKGLEVVSNA